ncbi:MAG: hypothetical protein ACE5DY_09165 [Mariprofundaceae bacterium]
MPNHARFYKHPVLQGFESRKAGRPIYKDEDFIEIQVPGQKNSIIKRAVQEKDKVDYPVEWNAWESNSGEGVTGSPIDHLPGITPSKVLELQALGIYTVEQIVDLNETGIQKVGHGARALIKTAEQYLGQTSEIDEVNKKNEALSKQIAELTEKVAALTESKPEKKAKRKRTPKQLANDKRLRERKKAA